MAIQQTFLRGYGGAAFDWGGDRGVFAGGWVQAQGPASQQIQYINLAGSAGGTASGFGNLALSQGAAYYQGGAMGNSIRALFVGNSVDSDNTNERRRIDYITTATTGSSSDFGDLQSNNGRYAGAGISNKTRGLFGGGFIPNSSQNTIDYRTIANTGTCQDFGNLSDQGRHYVSGSQDNTRGVFAGGYRNPWGTPVSAANTMDYVTIMTTGNASDFGDMLSGNFAGRGGVGDTTRGVWLGGYKQAPSTGRSNQVDYITIATTGGTTDFGDLTRNVAWGHPMGNETRAMYAGGEEPAYNTTIDYITIQTTGNASDFGDMQSTRSSGGCGSGTAS